MLDLLIIFVPYLPQTQSSALFTATATATMLEHHDATVQKKSYRLLKRLLETGRLGQMGQGEKLDEFVVKIGEAGAGIGPGAQRVRRKICPNIQLLISGPTPIAFRDCRDYTQRSTSSRPGDAF